MPPPEWKARTNWCADGVTREAIAVMLCTRLPDLGSLPARPWLALVRPARPAPPRVAEYSCRPTRYEWLRITRGPFIRRALNDA
jgi:hypothetical protein